jgi:glutamate carboxypeptidase
MRNSLAETIAEPSRGEEPLSIGRMTDSHARPLNSQEMLDDLRSLVECESPSQDLAAVNRSAEVVAGLLERRLGGTLTMIESGAGTHVMWSGGGEPVVLLLGHHDTVFPLGTLAQRPFAVSDGRVTGPGVFDMLGGLVQAIHGLRTLSDRSGVEFLVTADEEVGSRSSRSLIEERARACGAVLVLEGAAEGGGLKTGRKGCGTFRVDVGGRAAHAGLEPEVGVNALVEAAQQVLAIADMAAPARGTTVTPTVARAGTADNVVPAAAEIWVDVRVESAAEKERVEGRFRQLRPQTPGATLSVSGEIARPPMPETVAEGLFALAEEAVPGIGRRHVGGGSDGNFTAALGVPTLDGLGAVGGGAHADHEFAMVDRMPERAHLVAHLVTALQKGRLPEIAG